MKNICRRTEKWRESRIKRERGQYISAKYTALFVCSKVESLKPENEKADQRVSDNVVTTGRECDENEPEVGGFAESGTGDAGGSQKADGHLERGI